MSKKVISIALVVLMLFSMAMPSYALASGTVVGFTVSASTTTVTPGQEVEIIVSMQGDKDHLTWGGGVIPLAYDSSLITEPAVTSGDVVEDKVYPAFLTFSAGYGACIDTGNTIVEPIPYDDFTERDVDKNKGWDSLTTVAMVESDYYTFAAAETDEELFRYKFTVADDVAPGTKIYVGMPVGTFDTKKAISYMYSEDEGTELMHYYDGEVYDFTNATVELTVAAPVTVESVGTMAHMNNWEDTEATTYTAGLVGQINGLKLTFNETTGECDQIKEIKVTVEGSDKVGYAYKVYKVNDTTYQFRAILLDTPKTGTTALKYTFHVKLADDTVVTCSDSTTAKDIFDVAYGKYQDSKKSA